MSKGSGWLHICRSETAPTPRRAGQEIALRTGEWHWINNVRRRFTSWSAIGGARLISASTTEIYDTAWGMRSVHAVNQWRSDRSQGLRSRHSLRRRKERSRSGAKSSSGYGTGCCVWSTGSARRRGWAWAPSRRPPPSSAAWAWSGRSRSCPCSPCSCGRLAPADAAKREIKHRLAVRHQHPVTWLTHNSSF